MGVTMEQCMAFGDNTNDLPMLENVGWPVAVGNALEVKEAISTLKGECEGDLLELCYLLGGHILQLGGLAKDDAAARSMLQSTIADGSALKKFAEFVEAQGGDARAVYDPSRLPQAPVQMEPSTVRSAISRIL